MSANLEYLLEKFTKPVRQLKSYRGKIARRNRRRVLKKFVWDSYDFPAPILRNKMEDNSIFIGASDFSDYVFSNIIKERYEAGLSTINNELKLHGNRKTWNEYAMQTYVDCKIIQMNDSSGIILMNDLNLIRYDASSNSIEVKIYGDEDRKSTRLNSSHVKRSRMPSSA